MQINLTDNDIEFIQKALVAAMSSGEEDFLTERTIDLAAKIGIGRFTENLSFNALANDILEINKANGWNVTTPDNWEDTYKIPAILALITSETSEALEAFRNNDKDNFAHECADQIIRILDLTAGLGIDIDEAINIKLEKNKCRGFRHGGKRV